MSLTYPIPIPKLNSVAKEKEKEARGGERERKAGRGERGKKAGRARGWASPHEGREGEGRTIKNDQANTNIRSCAFQNLLNDIPRDVGWKFNSRSSS